MKKKEIKEQILKWAYEYAKSGNYENYSSIERKLHFDDGYPEARKILDDHYLRKELDELCYQAQQKENVYCYA